MEQPVQVKEVKILETAEDIQERREQVKQAKTSLQEMAAIKQLNEKCYLVFKIGTWRLSINNMRQFWTYLDTHIPLCSASMP